VCCIDETQLRQCSTLPLDAAVAELAARQHGVVSLAQFAALGLGARAAQYRGVSGRLHRVHRGVYAVGHRALTADGYRMAAVLACGPGAALSHRSAAAAWGFRPTARARIEVTVATSRRGVGRIELHRTKQFTADDVTHLRNIAITTVARTLVDLAAVLRPNALQRAVNQAEFLQLLDVTATRAAIQRAPGRAGVRLLGDLLSVPFPGPTRSEFEAEFLALCRNTDLPTPLMNRHVQAGGRLSEVDALWPDHRLIVELDGGAAHRTTHAFENDRRRDAALAARGYLVVRFTWQRLTNEPQDVSDELRHILALRARDCAA
jgi:very-short-patch-repair endonuclease/predicted transcriptional regulator of viral defense system